MNTTASTASGEMDLISFSENYVSKDFKATTFSGNVKSDFSSFQSKCLQTINLVNNHLIRSCNVKYKYLDFISDRTKN